MLVCLALVAFPAAAQESFRPTAEELRLLPKYCQEKFASKGRETAKAVQTKWSDFFGRENWIHMHHYCDGLNFLNRANRAAENERGHLLNVAISNFRYMQRNGTVDFVLLPELHLNVGNALLLRGELAEAAAEYRRAILIKPDYTPPYSALSDYFGRMGDISGARAILEQGLGHSPNSSLLKKKLAELNSIEKPK